MSSVLGFRKPAKCLRRKEAESSDEEVDENNFMEGMLEKKKRRKEREQDRANLSKV